MNLPKRRCLVIDNLPKHLGLPLLTEKSDQLSLQDRSVLLHNASDRCEQRYIIPVVWHIIIDSNMFGDVSDALLQRQVDILNGNHGLLKRNILLIYFIRELHII